MLFVFGCAAKQKPVVRKIDSNDPYFQFLKADIEGLEGHTRKSNKELGELVEKNPDVAFFPFLMANNLARERKFEAAVTMCEKALQLDPDFEDARVLLGRLYSSTNRHTDASLVFEKIIARDPKVENVYVLLANEYVAEKEYNKAIRTLRELIKINPDSVQAYFFIGTVNERHLDKPYRALSAYRDALAIDPANIGVLSAMAQLYLNTGNLKRALSTYEDIVHIDPEDVASQLKTALIYYELEDYDNAIKSFEVILERNPEADKIRYYLGVLYETVGRKEQSIEVLSDIPAASGFYKDSRLFMASVSHSLEENSDEASSILKAAIAEQPDIPEYYEYLASLLDEQGKHQEAIDILEDGRDEIPGDERLLFLLGMMYERIGDRGEAISIMKKVLKINPDNANALNYVGYTYADMDENLDKALEMIERAMALKPGDGFIADSLGWVYFRLGENEKALDYLKRANKIAPDEMAILEHIGDVYSAIGRTEDALTYYRQAFAAGKSKGIQGVSLNAIQVKIDRLEGI